MKLETDCPRCKTQKTAHIGRQDIGRIERHMHVCAECGLIFGITDAREWRRKARQWFDEKIEKGDSSPSAP